MPYKTYIIAQDTTLRKTARVLAFSEADAIKQASSFDDVPVDQRCVNSCAWETSEHQHDQVIHAIAIEEHE